MPSRPAPRGTNAALLQTPPSPVAISLATASLTWLVGWLLGNIAGSLVLSASGDAKVAVANRPVWLSAGMAVALWLPQIGAIVVAWRTAGGGHPLRDLSFRFTRFDLIGIPIGVLSQIALLRGVYWPLQKAWPDTFADRQLERNARDLYDRAHGVWLVVLVGVVVIAAPCVEELVYRGLLQGAVRRRFNDAVAVLAVAIFFALIHFRPVEYPGLFVFGLVLGVCAATTNRLGMGIAAHMAFNATALILVAR